MTLIMNRIWYLLWSESGGYCKRIFGVGYEGIFGTVYEGIFGALYEENMEFIFREYGLYYAPNMCQIIFSS